MSRISSDKWTATNNDKKQMFHSEVWDQCQLYVCGIGWGREPGRAEQIQRSIVQVPEMLQLIEDLAAYECCCERNPEVGAKCWQCRAKEIISAIDSTK